MCLYILFYCRVENHTAKDKNTTNVSQGKAKVCMDADVVWQFVIVLTCPSQVSSHLYSQLRPVRGDGVPKLTSPTHKKPQDKDNSGTHVTSHLCLGLYCWFFIAVYILLKNQHTLTLKFALSWLYAACDNHVITHSLVYTI